MNLFSSDLLRRAIPRAGMLAIAAACAVCPVAAQTMPAASDANHLIYLPSRSASVNQLAIIQALGEMGFTVNTLAYAGESQSDYARRVAGEVRTLLRQGVAPEAITVLGAGSGSPVAVLTSALTGNRRVNYVLLGQCDSQLKTDYGFRMSGRVLGLRDADDPRSHSCRPLWQASPKASARRDLVLRTGKGAGLFDAPDEAWLQPMAQWTGGGRVDVGNIRIGAVQRPQSAIRAAASAPTE